MFIQKIHFRFLGLFFFTLLSSGCIEFDAKWGETDPPAQHTGFLADCLPDGVSLQNRVSQPYAKTVAEALLYLKAVCRGNKLMDGSGREIRFLPAPCFGMNPGPERMLKAHKEFQKNLKKLQRKYTVIVLKRLCV